MTTQKEKTNGNYIKFELASDYVMSKRRVRVSDLQIRKDIKNGLISINHKDDTISENDLLTAYNPVNRYIVPIKEQIKIALHRDGVVFNDYSYDKDEKPMNDKDFNDWVISKQKILCNV